MALDPPALEILLSPSQPQLCSPVRDLRLRGGVMAVVILSTQHFLGESISVASFVCLFFVNFLIGWRNHRGEFSFPSKGFNVFLQIRTV